SPLFLLLPPPPPTSTLFPYTTLFRSRSPSSGGQGSFARTPIFHRRLGACARAVNGHAAAAPPRSVMKSRRLMAPLQAVVRDELRSEEHTSELQSRFDLVCRLLLEKKK